MGCFAAYYPFICFITNLESPCTKPSFLPIFSTTVILGLGLHILLCFLCTENLTCMSDLVHGCCLHFTPKCLPLSQLCHMSHQNSCSKEVHLLDLVVPFVFDCHYFLWNHFLYWKLVNQ